MWETWKNETSFTARGKIRVTFKTIQKESRGGGGNKTGGKVKEFSEGKKVGSVCLVYTEVSPQTPEPRAEKDDALKLNYLHREKGRFVRKTGAEKTASNNNISLLILNN